jgi:hypothetical protein
MATQIAVHGAAEVRFEHCTLDAGSSTEFRMLDFHVYDAEGNELLEVKVFDACPRPGRTPIALRPVEKDDD